MTQDAAGTLAAAQWITPRDEAAHHDDGSNAVWVLHRAFEVDDIPAVASFTITADGIYEAFINGSRVGSAELTPGSTAYSAILEVQQYDVRQLLRIGRNTLHVRLANGWYRGNNGTWRRRAVWGQELAVIGALSGSTLDIVTDGSWTARRSAVLSADLIDGQAEDHRRDDFSAITDLPVDVVERYRARLVWSAAEPVRRVQEIPPVSIRRLSPERQIVDFGQNISGWVRLRNLGPEGTMTTLEFAEHLGGDGDIDTAHLDSRAEALGRHVPFHQTDRVISGGKNDDEFEPRLTVHGFQYVRIDGYPTDLTSKDVTGILVHSDLRRTGWFQSSDDLLNRLHEAARWSFITNAVDVPTDCPTRERSGWTGDFQLFARTATYLYDIDAFGARWLRSLAADQLDDGRVPNIVPNNEHQPDPANPYGEYMQGSAGWGDAAVHVPWTLYAAYGDVSALRSQWPSIVAWVRYQQSAAENGRHATRSERSEQPAPHERYLWDSGFHWGEWLEGPQHRRDGTVRPATDLSQTFAQDPGELATAYYYRSAREASDIAAILGETSQSETLAALASKIKSAWQQEFLLPDGRTTTDTQAAYVRALAFGLYPEALIEAGVGHLVALIGAAGYRAETGFLSTPFLLPLLADHGHADLAFQILQNRNAPSWLAMIERGATTLWEEWDGIDEAGNATASLNHYSRGAIVEFFYSHILGIRSWNGGRGNEITIQPVPGGSLSHAHGRLLTRHGAVEVSWTCDADFELSATIPPEASGVVVMPSGAIHHVAEGVHRLAEPARARTALASNAITERLTTRDHS